MKTQIPIKYLLILTLVTLLMNNSNVAQNVGIGSESFTPDPSAGLEIKFTNKGLLLPRLTEANKSTIPTPIPESLIIFNSDTKCFETYIYGTWHNLFCPCIPSEVPTSITGHNPICFGSNTTLTVEGGSLGTGASWQWYTGSCGGVSVGTGISREFTPTVTTTYYVRAEGSCGLTDCVSYTVNVNNNPSTAIVGSNQNILGLVSNNLGGNTPSIGIGTWSITSGGSGTFSNMNLGSATFTAGNYGSYVLRWTISNTPCTENFAELTVDFSPDPCEGVNDYGYGTVAIGSQCWMASNLNTSVGVCYNNNSSNCNIYGKLYTWAEAIAECPTGWHLPSEEEWDVLTDHLGGFEVAANALKGTSFAGGTNSTGFNIKPGGVWDSSYNGCNCFSGINEYTQYWTSTSTAHGSPGAAWMRHFNSSNEVGRTNNWKPWRRYVRCIRD